MPQTVRTRVDWGDGAQVFTLRRPKLIPPLSGAFTDVEITRSITQSSVVHHIQFCGLTNRYVHRHGHYKDIYDASSC